MNRAIRFSLATAVAFSVTALHAVRAESTCPGGFDRVDGAPGDFAEDSNGNGTVCVKLMPGNGNGSRPYGFLIIVDDHDGNGK